MFDLTDAANRPPADVAVVLWIEYPEHIQQHEGEGEFVIGVLCAGAWDYLSHHPGVPTRWGHIPR